MTDSEHSSTTEVPSSDFDAIVVQGTLAVIPAIIFDVLVHIESQGTLPTGVPSQSLLLASKPCQIWYITNLAQTANHIKSSFLNWLSNKRGVYFPPHTNDNYIISQKQSIACSEFIEMCEAAGIDQVYVHEFAMKAQKDWGIQLMARIRTADPAALIQFDMGVVIYPEALHDNLDVIQPHIVLAMMNLEQFIEEGWHGHIQHYCVFPQIQAEVDNFGRIPCFGSVYAQSIGRVGGLTMNIENFKAYGTFIHGYKQRFREFLSFTTVQTVHTRIAKLHEIIEDLENHSVPALRLECRFRLPHFDVIDNEQHISTLWDAGYTTIIDLSQALEYLYLPVPFVCSRMRMTIEYFTSDMVHPSLQCYNKQNRMRLNNRQKSFFRIILMFLGWSSEHASRLFARNYYQHDIQDCPIDYLICAIWKYHLHINPTEEHLNFLREEQQAVLHTNIGFLGAAPPISRAIKYASHISLASDISFSPEILFNRYPHFPLLGDGSTYNEFITRIIETPNEEYFLASSLIPDHLEGQPIDLDVGDHIDEDLNNDNDEDNFPPPTANIGGIFTRLLLQRWLHIRQSPNTGKFRVNYRRGGKAAEDWSRMAVIVKIEATMNDDTKPQITASNWPNQLQLLVRCMGQGCNEEYIDPTMFHPVPPVMITHNNTGDLVLDITRQDICTTCQGLQNQE